MTQSLVLGNRHSCCSRWFTLSKTRQQMLQEWALLGKKTVWVLPKMNFSHEQWFHSDSEYGFYSRFLFSVRGRWGPADMETLSRILLLQHGVLLKQRPGLLAIVIFLRVCAVGPPHLVGRVQGWESPTSHLSGSWKCVPLPAHTHGTNLQWPVKPSHAKRRKQTPGPHPNSGRPTVSLGRDRENEMYILAIRVFRNANWATVSMAVLCSATSWEGKTRLYPQIIHKDERVDGQSQALSANLYLPSYLSSRLGEKQPRPAEPPSFTKSRLTISSLPQDMNEISPVSWDPQPEPWTPHHLGRPLSRRL